MLSTAIAVMRCHLRLSAEEHFVLGHGFASWALNRGRFVWEWCGALWIWLHLLRCQDHRAVLL